jgi:glycosyltransferase involved in cell wall biosynthesis
VLDDQIPAPHLGSGSPRTFAMLELLADLGLVVTVVPLTVRTAHQPATDHLQQLGIEVFHGAGWNPRDLLRARAGHYDVVIVSRPHNGAKFLPLARQSFADARLVYDAEALFCLRDLRRAALEGRPLSERRQQQMLRRELDVMKGADVVLTASPLERDLIRQHGGHHDVVVWGHAVEVRAARTPFGARRDLLFVGGFLDGHPPNTDAVVHFATALFPRIRRRLPDCRFAIVGADPPPAVRALASPHVVVGGHAPDLGPHYEAHRVFVVPHRFAAGISLKLIEAMSHGIPAVASTVGAAGLGLEDGREALIAATDDEFVDKVVRLHEEPELWASVQRAAQDHVRLHCSAEVMRRQLADAVIPREGPGA